MIDLNVKNKTGDKNNSIIFLFSVGGKWLLDVKRRRFFGQTPGFYGGLYLLFIPFFALVFCLISAVEDCTITGVAVNTVFSLEFLNSKSVYHISNELTQCEPIGMLDNLYFSAVTITTLGYGDYSPAGQGGRLLAGFEAVLGIVIIGLFLNSLAHTRDEYAYIRQQERKLRSNFFIYGTAFEEIYLSSKKISGDFKLDEDGFIDNYHYPFVKDYILGVAHIDGFYSSIDSMRDKIFEFESNVDLFVFPDLNFLIKSLHHEVDFSEYSPSGRDRNLWYLLKGQIDPNNCERNDIINAIGRISNKEAEINEEYMKVIYTSLHEKVYKIKRLIEDIYLIQKSLAEDPGLSINLEGK